MEETVFVPISLFAQKARLRLENTELSLKELGEMTNPPIGKSGANHRMRRLMEIAENL